MYKFFMFKLSLHKVTQGACVFGNIGTNICMCFNHCGAGNYNDYISMLLSLHCILFFFFLLIGTYVSEIKLN